MKTRNILPLIALGLLSTLNLQFSTALAQGTAFTYQGRLNDGGNPATGIYDLRVTIYDASSGGGIIAGPLASAATAITNGLFTVMLDFGSGVFNGSARWLEIAVRTNGSVAAFTTLAPLQPLTATPYALFAPNAGVAATAVVANSAAPGSIGAAALAPGAVDSSRIADGTIAANDLSLSILSNTFWRRDGNAGTTPGTHFLGTTDNQPLEIKVNNQRLLRLELGDFDFILGAGSVIGGAPVNQLTSGAVGATIAGGGARDVDGEDFRNAVGSHFGSIGGGGLNAIQANAEGAVIGGGERNTVQPNARLSTISGGSGNTIQSNALFASIAGGAANTVQQALRGALIGGGERNQVGSGASYSAIGGGRENVIEAEAQQATIAGGWSNHVLAGGAAIGGGSLNSVHGGGGTIGGGENNSIQYGAGPARIGGGWLNTIQTGAFVATIGGGSGNAVQSNAQSAAIGGGSGNTIQNNAYSSVIGGGSGNNIRSNAVAATIPGGVANEVAGLYGFAAGRRAKANHTGAFVWADSTDADFASTSNKQFLIRAAGGVGIGTNNPQSALHVAGVVTADTFSGSGAGLTGISAAGLTDGSVTSAKIAEGAVGSAQLGSNAVTAASLADGAVPASKVATATNTALLATFLNPSPADDDYFGRSVTAVGSDRVLIGASQDDTGATNAGAAYLFNFNGTLLTTFTNPTPVVGDAFGRSVTAVGGDRVLIAALYDDTGAVDAGAVYLFRTNGALLTTFTNPTPSSGDLFGFSLAAVGGDRVLIGAYRDDTGAMDAGAAYLFRTDGMLLTTFTNPTPMASDSFGRSVAAVGSDRVLIGAFWDDTGATDAGAAYLFSTNGSLLTTFTNPLPAVDDSFGFSLAAVGNDRVLIGAYDDDAGADGAGSAYLFSTNGTLLITFTNPTPASGDFFGYSVAALGIDRVLIVAINDFTGAAASGAAYLFSTDGALLTTLSGPTPAAGDAFGYSVAAIGDDKMLIGAYGDDTGATDSGAVYLFGPQIFNPGIVAEAVRASSVNTASLEEGAVTLTKLDPAIGVWTRSGTNVFRESGNVGIGTNSPNQRLVVAGNIYATGTITPNSDRNLKTGFEPVDAAAILRKVSQLSIQQWRFMSETAGVKHVGPMAQDFRAAFGLGEIPTAIATIDADGVALAAIQGLNRKLEARSQESEVRNQKLIEELHRRDAEIAELKLRLEKLERLLSGGNGGAK